MPGLVKLVRGLHQVEFDRGRIDDWCVYLHRSGQQRYPPKDLEYFEFFVLLGMAYGNATVYADFVSIYERTDNQISQAILNTITSLADQYGDQAIEADIWFTVIYAGMVAEENKANAILKKRIKRLAMHQILVEKMNPAVAVEFSKGKKWRDLDKLMTERGF